MKKIQDTKFEDNVREQVEALTEFELAQIAKFNADNADLMQKIAKSDRRHKDHTASIDDEIWLQIADGDSVFVPNNCKHYHSDGNFVDKIEEAECLKNGQVHYRNDTIKEVMALLSEKQRLAVELIEIQGYSTSEIAGLWHCSERNVRKLRERAIKNICNKYMKILEAKPNLTYNESIFIKWIHTGKLDIKPPLNINQQKHKIFTQQYNENCKPCVTVVPPRKAAV